jgi:hypothetical protein
MKSIAEVLDTIHSITKDAEVEEAVRTVLKEV